MKPITTEPTRAGTAPDIDQVGAEVVATLKKLPFGEVTIVMHQSEVMEVRTVVKRRYRLAGK